MVAPTRIETATNATRARTSSGWSIRNEWTGGVK
jgi:hypothetical protein